MDIAEFDGRSSSDVRCQGEINIVCANLQGRRGYAANEQALGGTKTCPIRLQHSSFSDGAKNGRAVCHTAWSLGMLLSPGAGRTGPDQAATGQQIILALLVHTAGHVPGILHVW